ncbi:MAG TPA: hypothetical protein VGI39_07465, partial [Polyangiaceae bacterium]
MAVAVASATPSIASAADPGPGPAAASQPAPVPAATVAPAPPSEPSFPGVNRYWIDDHLRHFAINLNPAALMVGRFSLDLQVIPIKHHAFVVTPFYTSTGNPPFPPTDIHSVQGAGFEAGYHFYGGDRGPNGFFVGPGFIY